MNWDDRITVLSVNPDIATRDEVARLAADLMEARSIIQNALDTHGSQVIADEKGVYFCPVSSGCEGTLGHEPDCWIGQASRYIYEEND